MITLATERDLFGQRATPTTEGIKYAGSKLKILPYIKMLTESLPGVKTVLDGFSGTTRVSQMFAQLGYDTWSNDIAVWSEVFATAYLSRKSQTAYYQSLIDHLNHVEGYEGWFSEKYGGTSAEGKRPFQLKNTMKLDGIRDEIERLKLSKVDEAVALTSLIYAMDAVDNTLGHYCSYLSGWSDRSYKDMKLRLPHLFEVKTNNTISRGDIFEVIGSEGRSFDLAYFDPPYGSNNDKMPPSRVRYNSYYHIWTSVVKNDKPDVFGKANRREDSRDGVSASVFEEFRKADNGRHIAMEALGRLIRNTRARYIILSYSSGGRATKQELFDILNSEGKLLRMLEIDYKTNVMGAMRWTNEWVNTDEKTSEYLFLIEK